MERIKVLVIRFNNFINRDEIPLFRGAIVHAMENANLLFHNHLENGKLRYSYPLIQYKRINRKAAIVCLGDGTEAIGQFFAACNFNVVLGDRQVKLEVEPIKPNNCLVQIWNYDFSYRIHRWLPLNKKNYKKYKQTDSLAEKYALLERILSGNILSFAKGLGIHFESQTICKLTAVDRSYVTLYKGVKMTAFDAEFKTNVSLPNFIGLGKGVSRGMGMLESIDNKNNEYE